MKKVLSLLLVLTLSVGLLTGCKSRYEKGREFEKQADNRECETALEVIECYEKAIKMYKGVHGKEKNKAQEHLEYCQEEKAKFEKFLKAAELEENEKYDEAIELYTELGDYGGAAARIRNIKRDLREIELKPKIDEAIKLINSGDVLAGFASLDEWVLKDGTNLLSPDEVDANLYFVISAGYDCNASKFKLAVYLCKYARDRSDSDLNKERVRLLDYHLHNDLNGPDGWEDDPLFAPMPGDIVTMGTYETGYTHDDMPEGDVLPSTYGVATTMGANMTYEKQPIQWIVLDVTADKALLLSKNVIANWMFGTFRDANDIECYTWENSNVRRLLNAWCSEGSKVFTSEERAKILKTSLTPSAEEGVDGGAATEDYVFLLSKEEFEKYKDTVDLIKAYPTSAAYLAGQGWVTERGHVEALQNPCWWCLRTTATTSSVGRAQVLAIWPDGTYDRRVLFYENYVRPAMWVKIG